MSSRHEFLVYVLEQLAAMPAITARRMFGGVGLYSDGLFFALIGDDTLYFKVDDGNRADYESRGMRPFVPFDEKPTLVMSYYQVPPDVLEDPEQLCAWARRAVQVALAARATVAPRDARGKMAQAPRTSGRKLAARTAQRSGSVRKAGVGRRARDSRKK